jgi:GAF domain-containing protein
MEKEAKYKNVVKIINSVIETESDLIANMANICAILKEHFDWLWIGFYRVDQTQRELVLGPFQGPLACTRIPYGKGVCGKSWADKISLVVDNVHEFEGHIACSSLSNSEIVVPVFIKGEIGAILDIDSTKIKDFDDIDRKYLTMIAQKLTVLFS